jgi:spore germination protein KB
MILISFVVVCAMAVRKGPVTMTRYGFLAAFIAILAILINSILLSNMTNLRYLQPAFMLPASNYLIGAHIVTMLPFCETMSFMMMIPAMEKPEEFGRAMRIGLCIGAVTLVYIVLRDITVLGSFTAIFSMPTFSSIRMINIGDILTRLEIVYAVILIGLLFFKVSTVYWATVSGISRVLAFKSYRYLISVIGALVVLYAMACFPVSAEHVQWNMTTAATYSSFFLLILPLVTLCVSLIKGKAQSRRTAQETM